MLRLSDAEATPMTRRRTLVASLLLACAPSLACVPSLAWAQKPGPGMAARRFPQPVRSGDLIGRQVLRPVEQQNVLGRIAAIVRQPAGAILVVVDVGGLLGFGTRPVAVPIEATALLGEYVALLDLTPDQLRALPPFEPSSASPVPADEVIRVGLTRPFH